MTSKCVRLERDGQLALIIVNNPPVNTITADVRAGLSEALQELRRGPAARAVLLLCEGSTFFSGADIGEFSGPPREVEYRQLFNALEALEVPVIAAMHGTVMGGGLEIALACHYRGAVAATKFALPEVTLGIIPGAGGTQRLPRLIGAEKALDFILSAKPVTAPQAKELGILDVVFEGDVRAAAVRYANELLAAGSGPRRTGEMKVDPATAGDAMFARMAEQARKLYPNRTAGLVAVDAVRKSATASLAEGLEYETTRVNECKLTAESRGAVHVFFAERDSRRVPGLSEDVAAASIESAGVIGAGTMGGGIAICFANAGIPVTLIDASAESLQRGVAGIERIYQSMVDRGRISDADRQQRLALIQTSLDYASLARADVVVEAVFEDLSLKRQIFGKLDAVAKPGAILATNTSTLDINDIAAATRRPGDVIGMHFFSPANVMPLLEVVRTDQTSDRTIKTVMALSKPLRKTPVLARVCYGFIGNRMMEGYAREAQRMVLEGATPRAVDGALEEWGMAMGILAVFDMAGVDVGVNVHKANATRYPPDPTYYQADFALAEAGRLGQKSGKGYYRYEKGNRSRFDDPEAIDILRRRAQELQVPQRTHSVTEMQERCLFPLLNEGFHVLGEGIATRAADIDVVWTSGYGFPRYRGGPMFYAETIGLKTLLDGIHRYRDTLGADYGRMHWQPAPLLVELVKRGIGIAEWEREQQAKRGQA